MPDAHTRASVVQETLELLGTDAPSIRSQIESVVDHLPHIFSYDADRRAQMVRYHVLRRLQEALSVL